MKKLLPLVLYTIICLGCNKTIVTPYEFAMLSADVYDDLEQPIPDHIEAFLDYDIEQEENKMTYEIDFSDFKEVETPKELGSFLVNTVGKNLAKGGYFGRAYICPARNELIIAHRGTDLDSKELNGEMSAWKRTISSVIHTIKDIDDDYAIFKGEVPEEQFEAAEKLTRQALEKYIEQYGDIPKIIHTGHSLGAVLAELCAAKHGKQAITFESTGSKPMIQKLLGDEVNWKKLNITSYNAEPNGISSLHEHVGTVIPLYDTEQTTTDFSEANKNTLGAHSIENILDQFNPNNGLPLNQ